jgi:chaperonin GroES
MKKPKKAKAAKKMAPKKALPAAKKTASAAAVKKNALGTPYGDRVLVKPQAAEQTTSFGIIIPDQAKEKPEKGVVVAVGEGKMGQDGKTIPMRVGVGDTIMFSKYGYEEVKIGGAEYYLIREDSITFIF